MSQTQEKAGKLKVKAKVLKPKNLSRNDEPIKIDLSQPKIEEQDAIQTQKTNDSDVVVEKQENSVDSKEVAQEVRPTEEVKPVIEEIIEEKPEEEEVVNIGEEMVQTSEKPVAKVSDELPKQDINLPENIEKVVDFMKETGGTLEDYVRLNADYSNVDNDTLLREYYKQTKSHLDSEEISFLMEDNFKYAEELD